MRRVVGASGPTRGAASRLVLAVLALASLVVALVLATHDGGRAPAPAETKGATLPVESERREAKAGDVELVQVAEPVAVPRPAAKRSREPVPAPKPVAAVRPGRLAVPFGTPADEVHELSVRDVRAGTPPSVVALAEDGTFQVPAAATSALRFSLVSRFLILEQAQPEESHEEPRAVLVLRPALGARIAGRVRVPWSSAEDDDESHTVTVARLPATQAEWSALHPRFDGRRPERLAEAETQGGAFAVDALPAGVPLLVEVQVDGGLPVRERLVLVAGETRALELVPEQAATLSGTVVTPPSAGLRVPEVAVEAQADDGSWSALKGGGRVRAEGRFELEGLPPGPLRLVATGQTTATLEIHAPPGRTDGLVIALGLPGELRGEVVWDDGSAIDLEAGEVRVNLQDSNRWRRGAQRTGARFQFTELTAGQRCWLRARCVDRAGDLLAITEVREFAVPDLEVELRLPRPATVAGRVQHADGSPAAGVLVRPRNDRARVFLTDSAGTFGGLQPAGVCELVATAKGCTNSEVLALDLAPGATRSGLVLTLGEEGARLHGTLVDATGAAIARTSFTLVLTPDSPSRAGESEAGGGASLTRSVLVDGRGGFRVSHLRPGTWRVTGSLTPPANHPLWSGAIDARLDADGGLVVARPAWQIAPCSVVLREGETSELRLVASLP